MEVIFFILASLSRIALRAVLDKLARMKNAPPCKRWIALDRRIDLALRQAQSELRGQATHRAILMDRFSQGAVKGCDGYPVRIIGLASSSSIKMAEGPA
jgi:hypothetical protein